MNALGMSNLDIMFLLVNLITSISLIGDSDSVFAHFVKQSVTANRNFLLPKARDRTPTMSILHWAKGHRLVSIKSLIG